MVRHEVLENWLGFKFGTNKRNGKKQKDHLKEARATRNKKIEDERRSMMKRYKELLERYKTKHQEDKTEIKMLREQIQILKEEL